MKPLSKIAAGVSPSATLAVSALAKKMKAEGKDVIGFGAGEPDFATPDRISYAGVRAICDGKTRYTPAAGMIELRQAICDRVKTDSVWSISRRRRSSPAVQRTWSTSRWLRWSTRAMR